MAYALKYTHEFHQLKKYSSSDPEKASLWRIEISQEGWGGGSSVLNCDRDSIVLSREGDLLDIVQGSKLSMSIINQIEGEFKEFREADWGEYEVRLYKDGNNSSELPTPIVDQTNLVFDDVSDSIDLGNITGLNDSLESTVHFKMTVNSSSGNTGVLFKSNQILIKYDYSTNTLNTNLVIDGLPAIVSAPLTVGVEYIIDIVYQSDVLTIYVDGVSVDTDASRTGDIDATASNMYIGNNLVDNSCFMDIVGLKIYDEAITPDNADVLKFVGYNQSEIYTEPYDQPPYSSVMEFTCGLNHLKNVRFEQDKIDETKKNTNSTATVSASLKLGSIVEYGTFTISDNSGAHANHVITLQTSTDDITFINTAYSLTGLGDLNFARLDDSVTHIRLKVTTAEGGSSAIDWSTYILYFGQKSVIEMMRLALNKLPSPLSIREFVNIYEDSNDSGVTFSMLNQIYVDCSVYKEVNEEENTETGIFCNNALDKVLKAFGINIYQANGIWYIVRVEEYNDTTMYYREFLPSKGSEQLPYNTAGSLTTNKRVITSATTAENELILVSPSSELSIEPPLNRVVISYNQNNVDQESHNFIKNGDFESVIFLLYDIIFGIYYYRYIPRYWVFTGVDPSTYAAIRRADWNGTNEVYFNFDPLTQETAFSLDTGIYMDYSKANMPISTSDSMVLEFNFHFEAVVLRNISSSLVPIWHEWFRDSCGVTYEMEITLGAYWLRGSYYGGFYWDTSFGICSFTVTNVEVGQEATGGFNISKNDWFRVVLPTLPDTAVVDFKIRVFQPYSNAIQYTVNNDAFSDVVDQYIEFAGLKLTYLPVTNEPVEELIINTTINDGENLEEVEVYHADGSNTGTLNSYRLSSGLITDLWSRRSLADNLNILKLFLTQLGVLKGEYVRELSALVIGEIDIFNTIEHTTDLVHEYYIKTYEWNIATGEYNLTLSEIGKAGVPLSFLTNPKVLRSLSEGDSEVTTPITGEYQKITTTTSTAPVGKVVVTQKDLNNYI